MESNTYKNQRYKNTGTCKKGDQGILQNTTNLGKPGRNLVRAERRKETGQLKTEERIYKTNFELEFLVTCNSKPRSLLGLDSGHKYLENIVCFVYSELRTEKVDI